LIYCINVSIAMAMRGRRRGANVNLSTVVAVEQVLRIDGGPLSRNEILRRLSASAHSTTRQKLNAVLAYLESHGLTGEGSKGVQWIANRNPKLIAAIVAGERVR